MLFVIINFTGQFTKRRFLEAFNFEFEALNKKKSILNWHNIPEDLIYHKLKKTQALF